MTEGLSPRGAVALLAIVVVAWGTNWPVTKMIVHDMSPLWSTALRCGIAAAVLAPLRWAQGNVIIPKRGDMPVVLCTTLLHMMAFSARRLLLSTKRQTFGNPNTRPLVISRWDFRRLNYLYLGK